MQAPLSRPRPRSARLEAGGAGEDHAPARAVSPAASAAASTAPRDPCAVRARRRGGRRARRCPSVAHRRRRGLAIAGRETSSTPFGTTLTGRDRPHRGPRHRRRSSARRRSPGSPAHRAGHRRSESLHVLGRLDPGEAQGGEVVDRHHGGNRVERGQHALRRPEHVDPGAGEPERAGTPRARAIVPLTRMPTSWAPGTGYRGGLSVRPLSSHAHQQHSLPRSDVPDPFASMLRVSDRRR